MSQTESKCSADVLGSKIMMDQGSAMKAGSGFDPQLTIEQHRYLMTIHATSCQADDRCMPSLLG
jgi:hypothetical protein